MLYSAENIEHYYVVLISYQPNNGCSKWIIQVDQEFLAETDTTVNNTGKDIMGEQASIPFLSQITRSLWLLLIQKITVLLKIIFHPWKDSRLAARSALQIESLGGYAYILNQFHSVISVAELQKLNFRTTS